MRFFYKMFHEKSQIAYIMRIDKKIKIKSLPLSPDVISYTSLLGKLLPTCPAELVNLVYLGLNCFNIMLYMEKGATLCTNSLNAIRKLAPNLHETRQEMSCFYNLVDFVFKYFKVVLLMLPSFSMFVCMIVLLP